jgi:GNAT superfamily N-acetyltransferase
MITYRKATAEDIRPALDLALRVFMEFDAPENEPEGVEKFKADIEWKAANSEMYLSGNRLLYVASDDNKIISVIESNRPGHINMVFVDGAYHRRGIATTMMEWIVCELKLRGDNKITLKSTPYGLPFYLHFGFVPTDTEQRKDGFIFTPTEYIPNEIWDVLDENGNKTGRYAERGRKMATGDSPMRSCLETQRQRRVAD